MTTSGHPIRRRALALALRCTLAVIALVPCGRSTAQELFWGVPMVGMPAPVTPPNLDCGTATVLTDSYAFLCAFCYDHFDAMWYAFDVAPTEGAYVSIGFSGHGAEIYAADALDGACEGTPLYSYPVGDEQSVTSFSGMLAHGRYYVKILLEEGSNDQACLIRFNDNTYPGPPVVNVSGPVNDACSNALLFCEDVVFHIQDYGDQYTDRCGWFRFEIEEEQHVSITMTMDNIVLISDPFIPRVRIIGPRTEEQGCTGIQSCANNSDWEGELPFVFDEVLQPGIYYLSTFLATTSSVDVGFHIAEGDLVGCELPCPGCIPGFVPVAGERYLVTAWTQQQGAPADASSFTTPIISVGFLDDDDHALPHYAEDGFTILPSSYHPTGPIIDGWQRIEGLFRMPPTAVSFHLDLGSSTGTVYYDDVRVQPADGSMKCFVYDPENLRFMAELDERHFATFYEYDGEGKLTRVKKETERGVMTIQETRYNSSKLP